MKVKQAAGSQCYVLALNATGSAVPEAVLNASAPVSIMCYTKAQKVKAAHTRLRSVGFRS